MLSRIRFAQVILGSILTAVALFFVLQAMPAFAQAQPTNTTTAGDAGGFVPCGNTADNPCQIGHLFSAFVVIINYLITMAGLVAVVAIVYAGFSMISSQAEGNDGKLKEAKSRFSGAVVGLVLVAAAFLLINAIFSGSFSLGVRDGAQILSSPLDYIKSGQTDTPPTNTNIKTNANTKGNSNTKSNSNIKTK